MDIKDVKAKVDKHIGADHVLTLHYQNNDLSSAPIDAVIHTYFADTLTGLVHLVNGQTAVVDEKNQLVIYSLSLTVKNFSLYKSDSPIETEITFSIKNDVIQFTIKTTLPAVYSLSDSFAALKSQSPINQIKLEKSVITLQSGATPVSQFSADLLPVGPLASIDWMLKKKKTPITGTIDFELHGGQHFPSINLATPNLDPFSFGGVFELDLIVRLRSAVKPFANQQPAYVLLTHVELVTEFKTKELTLPVVMPLHGEGSYLLSFYLDLDKPKPPIKSLDALSGFTGGSDPKQFLNPELDLGAAKLELDSLSAVLDPYNKALVSVEIGISLELDWTIITDKLELEKIGAIFTIDNPTDPKAENITAELFAKMKVGTVGLDASVVLPDKTFQAQLAPGSVIDVNEVLHTFSPTLKLPGNDNLTVYQLEVFAHAKKGEESFSIEAGADGELTIIDGLAFDHIYFFLSYASKAVSNVNLNTTFRLTSIQVDVDLLSQFDIDNGWQFEGTTGPGQAIPLGSLIEDISKLFGTVSVPAVIKKLSIKDLKISFNTKSKDFHFNITADFGDNAETILTFSNLHQLDTQTFEKRATGVIKVFPGKKNELEFDLGLDLKPDSKDFVAVYNNTSQQSLNISGLVKAMFHDASSLPIPDFNITIKDAIIGYVKNDKTGKTDSVFALDIGASLDLTSLGDIPLIGKILSAAKTLKLAFQLLYPTTAPFLKADLGALNSLITVAGPRFPVDEDLTALKIKTELRIGDDQPIDFNLPVTVNPGNGQIQSSSGGGLTPPPGAQPTNDGVSWFQLNKQFGPVHLQRAGFKFENGVVTALLDGGLTALGLEVDLMGLSVKSKITDVQNGEFKPEFSLQGLGLSFSKGGVGFAGALLRRGDEKVKEYAGLASVTAEGIRLAAIGSLTKANNQTSLFLYAVLDYPLGGTPFFYVTGLAGGFGLNEKLIMPPVDQVRTFPLIDAAFNPPTVPTDPGSAGTFINDQMTKLEKYLVPNVGQYFGCAGVRFTSFELLDSFVLVSISFGREFELDLLGISTLVVPPQLPAAEPPLAKVSLQIVASFIPDQGIAIVQGSLTADSHILDPKCHLTGGFAFATWFGTNSHAGDFVITLGGYHPDFQKPAHYPTVPRVGINWQITPQLSVTGGLYFALTPRALMAGGAMRAVFQTSLDIKIATIDVKAWFILGADFIVYWKPFHYSAHLYIDIGIDVVIHFLGTHDIGFDAGADLQVWGPPFGGHAHISFKIIGIRIGFDVDFGASAPKPDPLDWENADPTKSFRQSFLPKKDAEIVSVAISNGLERKVDRAGKDDAWYIINVKDFCVRTNSVIPIKDCTGIQWDKNKPSGDHNKDFGIASMNKGRNDVLTSHQITVTPDVQSQFVARPILTHVPGGLWAESNSTDINAELLIENAMVGVEIVPAEASVAGDQRSIERKAVDYTTYRMESAYVDNAISSFTVTCDPGNDPAENRKLWRQIESEINQRPARATMLTAMGFTAADFDIGEPFSSDAAYAPSYGHLKD